MAGIIPMAMAKDKGSAIGPFGLIGALANRAKDKSKPAAAPARTLLTGAMQPAPGVAQ